MPKPSRADYAFAAALLKLPEPQRSKAFVKLVDDLNDTLPPVECLAALYRKKKREQDLKRFAELDIHSKSAVFLALSRGDDPEPFLPPAPDGAGYPEDGHNGPTNPLAVRLCPREATRTPNRSCHCLAECDADGRRVEAQARSDVVPAIARVQAGVPDRPLTVSQDGLRGHIRYRSFAAMGRRAIRLAENLRSLADVRAKSRAESDPDYPTTRRP